MNVLIFLALAGFATAHALDYNRYDNFNIDEVISNERLITAHVKCYLGTGKCTPEGVDIKKAIPDALQNSCGKCTPKQKILVARMIKALMEKLPGEWEKLKKLHSPDGKYDEAVKEFVKEYGNKSN